LQQLDNDDEGEDDDDDRNDSEEAIDAGLVGAPVASTCKQRSSEPKPTILFCSVCCCWSDSPWLLGYTAGHGCATTYQGMDDAEGDCSQHQLHGGDHQQAAQHHCQYRTHEEDRQPGQGLC